MDRCMGEAEEALRFCCCCCFDQLAPEVQNPAPDEQVLRQQRTCATWNADCFGLRPNTSPNEMLLDICRDLKFGRYGPLDVAQKLDVGADPNVRDSATQNTPLHFAAKPEREDRQHVYLEITSLLLQRGADVNAKGWYSSTPLHNACSVSHIPTIKLLLQHGADIQAQDGNASRPLHYAAAAGNAAVLELLISHGADVTAKDNDGNTAHHLAIDSGHTEAAAVIKRQRNEATGCCCYGATN